MAKIVLNIEGAEGTKLKRAVEAHALEQGQTVEECLLPTLRGIAQHVGVNFAEDETDQEEAVSRAESDARKAESRRVEAAAERSRLAAEAEKPKTATAKN